MHMTIPSPTHPESTGISPGTSDSTGDEPDCRFVADLPPDEVHRRALAAGKLLARAEKTLASWLVEINDRRLYRNFACSSIFHYGARFLKLAGHTVAEYLRTGRKLAELPLLSAAYEKGEISGTHMREITRVATAATEGFWHKAAKKCTTREIEKMVAFTPKGGLPPLKNHEASSFQLFHETARASGISIEEHASPPDTRGPVPCRLAPACTPVSTLTSCVTDQEEQVKYHDKLVIDLTSEEMAVMHDAFRKARKESGKSDRRSLLVYMARVFLEGTSPDKTVKKSTRRVSPYRVVFHHHLPSGLSWCETAKGERPIPPQALEKALCDAELREAEDMTVPPRPAGDAKHSPVSVGNEKKMTGAKAGAHQQERMAYVNELYRKMKEARLAASPGGKRTQQKQAGSVPRRGTIPSTLRKKVLERDGHRCLAPGCGRDRFLALHHLNPAALGGKDEASSLITLCWSCHDLLHEGGLSVEGHAPYNLLWGEGKKA